ncbi:hypothetical protein [Streptomyces sp. NPDC053755]|jgi:hypothetical protein|uniref:hypothetical protein n=1 Tax=Streptomyces sp. NPDC053755 TaxID=3155815 RepID=UPI0034493B90
MATPERARAADRITMSDLLASCAAASAVSTPPREPDEQPEAAPDIEPEAPARREAA